MQPTPSSDAFSFLIPQQSSSTASRSGPLAKYRLAVKDNIDVNGVPCPAGLPMRENYTPSSDAPIVTLLRAAGASLVGMTETDAGGFGVTTPAVTNPKYPDRVAGGSSGGSAAAVSAGDCDIAVGTDTGGSIRIPAACCGVYGFKPTFGRLPTEGILPLAKSLDHVGPIAGSLQPLIQFMQAADPHFRSWDDVAGTARLDEQVVIGVAEEYVSEAHQDVAKGVQKYIQTVCSDHMRIKKVDLPSADEVMKHYANIFGKESAEHYAGLSANELQSMPKGTREAIMYGKEVPGEEYKTSTEVKAYFVSYVEELFSDVDYILLPTIPVLPPKKGKEQVGTNKNKGKNKLKLVLAKQSYLHFKHSYDTLRFSI